MLHLQDICGTREIDENTRNVQAFIHVARCMVKTVEEFSEESTTTLGQRKAEAGQCQKIDFFLTAPGILEFEKNLKTKRMKVESHMESAMPCKSPQSVGNTILKTSKVSPDEQQFDEHQIIYGHKSKLMNHKDAEIEKAEIGVMKTTHCNIAHQPIPISEAMKILDAKAVVDNAWDKLKNLPAWR